MEQITVELRSIAEDGLPDMDNLRGRVAFLWFGNLINGWPLYPEHSHDPQTWEGDSDVSANRRYGGVTHYLVFAEPFWDIERKPVAATAS